MHRKTVITHSLKILEKNPFFLLITMGLCSAKELWTNFGKCLFSTFLNAENIIRYLNTNANTSVCVHREHSLHNTWFDTNLRQDFLPQSQISWNWPQEFLPYCQKSLFSGLTLSNLNMKTHPRCEKLRKSEKGEGGAGNKQLENMLGQKLS